MFWKIADKPIETFVLCIVFSFATYFIGFYMGSLRVEEPKAKLEVIKSAEIKPDTNLHVGEKWFFTVGEINPWGNPDSVICTIIDRKDGWVKYQYVGQHKSFNCEKWDEFDFVFDPAGY